MRETLKKARHVDYAVLVPKMMEQIEAAAARGETSVYIGSDFPRNMDCNELCKAMQAKHDDMEFTYSTSPAGMTFLHFE